jgi:hypothetical protein
MRRILDCGCSGGLAFTRPALDEVQVRRALAKSLWAKIGDVDDERVVFRAAWSLNCWRMDGGCVGHHSGMCAATFAPGPL